MTYYKTYNTAKFPTDVYDPFGVALTSSKTSTMNFKPTWGASDLRYDKTTTGTGATIAETNGELVLSTGTATSNVVTLKTKQIGQYQAGTEARFGIGIRLGVMPTSTEYFEWGYCGTTNGFLFGVDSTGVYVCRRTGGVNTKVYQTSWNVDVLDGTGPSGLTLDLTEGVICQCKFTWYGYGAIKFGFVLFNSKTKEFVFVHCHTFKVEDALSIVDPNQSLTMSAYNGATNTTSRSLYVGGHQFEYFDGGIQPQRRELAEVLIDYTTALDTNWQPLIAVRKKATHGPSSRANSVAAYVTGYAVAGDGQLVTRLTYGATTSNLAWAAPTGWTAAESAVETKLTTSGTALTTSVTGFPYLYDFVASDKKAMSDVSDATRLALGVDTEVILWVKRLSASGAIKVLQAHVDIQEEW